MLGALMSAGILRFTSWKPFVGMLETYVGISRYQTDRQHDSNALTFYRLNVLPETIWKSNFASSVGEVIHAFYSGAWYTSIKS